MDSQTKKANFSLALAKVFSGVNMNGLKYLLPLWMSAITGVTARCLFGAIAFWLVSLFIEKDQLNWKQRIVLFFSGAIILYSALICFLLGLSLTTPISGAIFCSLQPIFVFIISLLVFHEKLTVMKIIGMILGMGGAILCVTTQKSGALASNALLGNVLCALCALFFGINLYIEKYFIKQQLNNVTILKYLFLGATVSAFCVNGIIGFHAPLITDALKGEWHLMPWIVLLFILVGPTFLNYFLSIFGLRYLKTTVASLYGYLSLIVASVVSYLLKQDKFSWFQILAMIMICLSIYFVEIADKKDKTQSK